MKPSILIVLGLAAISAGCNDNDPTALARVDRVLLSPQDTTVEHPDSFRYDVQLLDADGDVIDDERPMTFQVDDQDIANITSGGYVRTEDNGVTTVRAVVGGTTGTATLTVVDFDPSPVVAPPPN